MSGELDREEGEWDADVLLEYDLSTSELISFLREYEAQKLGLDTKRLTPTVAIFRDGTQKSLCSELVRKASAEPNQADL